MGFKELEYGDMPSSMNISKVRYTEAADYQRQLQEQRAEARVIEIKPWFKQQAALTVQDYLDDFPEIHGEGGPTSDTPMLINLGGAGAVPKDEMVPVECPTLLEFVQMWAGRAGTMLTPLIGGEGLSYKIGFLDEEHKWVHMTRDAYLEGRADLREDEGLHATLTELLAKIDPDLTPERIIKDLGNPAKRGELFHLGSKPIDLLPEDLKGYRAALRQIPDLVEGRVKDTFDVQAERPVSRFVGMSEAELRVELDKNAAEVAEYERTKPPEATPAVEEEAPAAPDLGYGALEFTPVGPLTVKDY